MENGARSQIVPARRQALLLWLAFPGEPGDLEQVQLFCPSLLTTVVSSNMLQSGYGHGWTLRVSNRTLNTRLPGRLDHVVVWAREWHKSRPHSMQKLKRRIREEPGNFAVCCVFVGYQMLTESLFLSTVLLRNSVTVSGSSILWGHQRGFLLLGPVVHAAGAHLIGEIDATPGKIFRFSMNSALTQTFRRFDRVILGQVIGMRN